MNKKNLELMLKIHNENFLDIKNIKDFDAFYKNSRYNIYEEYFENIFAGYLITYDNVDSLDIFEIAVDKNFRKKGLASKLLNRINDERKILLEVSEKNKVAINLYKKNGFKMISRRKNYYLDGSDAIVMIR
ncbi:MAG: GNAT family N-acetyltransferase [Streptobacillus sp.]